PQASDEGIKRLPSVTGEVRQKSTGCVVDNLTIDCRCL
ncbi:hypothetical protein CEXT_259171, partial [Caerostris extrusa]